ncbi:MAG TPA: hypothetical protein EYP59_04425 [Thiotrichaceae bacterium]|nr:hypothetical protein [Thiotrichaceae bacterium]
MSQLKHKKALMGAALLATAPALKASGGGSTEGSKSQRGINHLTLEEAPLENITICVPGKSATGMTGDFRFLPDKIAVVIDPFEKNFVKMTFVVSHMTASNKKRKLILAYSTQKSPSPQIPTPKSINKLELDLSAAEIVGIYNVSDFGMEAQDKTRIGAGNPAPRVKWEFDINLDNSTVPVMMNSGQDTIYVQAALLPSDEFESGKYDNMILSEVDTIQFVPNECPDTMDGERVTEFNLDEQGVNKSGDESDGGSGTTNGDGK